MKKSRRRMAIFLIIIFTSTIVTYLVNNIIKTLKYSSGNPNQIIYKSNVNSDIKYNVYLKPNTFFDVPFVGDDFSYITSLVQTIKTNFVYDFVGNNNVPVSYDYYIETQIVANDTNEDNSNIKPLWLKNFMLLEHQKGNVNDSKINIDEKIDINLDYYNSLIEAFRLNTNLILNSRLDVTFVIHITGDLKLNKQLNKEHILTITIPLGVKTFDIATSKSFPDQEMIYSKEQVKTETSYVYVIFYLCILIILLWLVIFIIKLIINKDKNKYEALVSKLLNDYDDRIVTVSNFIRYERMEIVEVPDFDELLTLSDEALEPIIYWEKRGRNYREAWFSIIKDKILYRYVITYKK